MFYSLPKEAYIGLLGPKHCSEPAVIRKVPYSSCTGSRSKIGGSTLQLVRGRSFLAFFDMVIIYLNQVLC